jgi:hypothetical protein
MLVGAQIKSGYSGDKIADDSTFRGKAKNY